MSDLYTTLFGQVPQLSQTLTISPPDILGNMSISTSNGTVGSISEGLFGEMNIQMGGEVIAKVQDSVYGNYQIVTGEGTFTAMDNVYGGDTLYELGQAVAISRPGLFDSANWYDASTSELLATSGMNGFGQTTITIPSNFDTSAFETFNGLDSLTVATDYADFASIFAGSSDFFDFLDFF